MNARCAAAAQMRQLDARTPQRAPSTSRSSSGCRHAAGTASATSANAGVAVTTASAPASTWRRAADVRLVER
ncbi:hypothetical protein BGI50_12035 [Burkholderia pseudomallei]|nr:hypothetical protein BGI50_12035 [Burkholderia pseudomallei]OMO13115.1 hypothetical protein BGI48_12090 [Burkholderia pseudomallei]